MMETEIEIRHVFEADDFGPEFTPELAEHGEWLNKPSALTGAFLTAVDEIADVSARLFRLLETSAPSKNRKEEAAKAEARAAERFGL